MTTATQISLHLYCCKFTNESYILIEPISNQLAHSVKHRTTMQELVSGSKTLAGPTLRVFSKINNRGENAAYVMSGLTLQSSRIRDDKL